MDLKRQTMRASTFVAATAVMASVSAQAGTDTAVPPAASGLSQCAFGCIDEAATNGPCQIYTNTTCVCTNTDFQQTSASCIQAHCPGDMAAAQALQQESCSGFSSSASVSASVTESISESASKSTETVTSSSTIPHVSESPAGVTATGTHIAPSIVSTEAGSGPVASASTTVKSSALGTAHGPLKHADQV
uniref:CFEM domain-containing protein n=1 Tax=Mycena chlorophos TaxID=658473 RepID=A0ABQ0KYG8_MYCCL|nr:predicted protein [Mycena chlorophos]